MTGQTWWTLYVGRDTCLIDCILISTLYPVGEVISSNLLSQAIGDISR